MSWAGLASNQIVSDTNLANAVATGVFAAKTSIPSTGRELTTTAAQNYAYVDVSGGRASNQLVSKSSLSASYVGPGPFPYNVFAVDQNSMLKSTNGGFTFSRLTGLPYEPNTYVWTSCAANSSGQYLIAASSSINMTVWVSSDYGNTFYSQNFSGSWPYAGFYPMDVDVSESGQYMAVVGKTQPTSTDGYVSVAISNDYGSTFTIYTGAYQNTRTATEAHVTVSGNGYFVAYVAASNITNNSWRYRSTNYGSSFSYGGLSTNQLFSDIASSYDGTYSMIVNRGTVNTAQNTGNIFVSNNYGSTFASKSTQGYLCNCGMSSDGYLMYASGPIVVEGVTFPPNYGYIYDSPNYGNDWYEMNNNLGQVLGMAVGTLLEVPSVTNYVAAFCNYNSNEFVLYKPPLNPLSTYEQPVSYNLYNNNNGGSNIPKFVVYKRAYPV